MALRTWALAACALIGAFGVAGAQSGPSLAPPKPTAPAVVAPQAAAPAQPGGHTLDKSDVDAWLDGYMPYALDRAAIPGAVVVVVKDGQVLTQRGYGYADLASHKLVDPETTLFRPGSVSKLYTWTALMQMVEQGKVSLDADINTYLDFKIPPYQGKPVTVRNLMTHTAGFEETIKGLITAVPAKVDPLDIALKRWVPARIFPPGEVPAYSNYGASLAGYIVQRVSGQPFEDYVAQHIFAPLGMKNASFRQPLPAALQPQMASGYAPGSQKAEPFEEIPLAPAGSSAISGADMARFMIAHLQDGEYQGQRILKPETARLMHGTPYTVIQPSLHRMLLGFYETDRNGHRGIAHGGDSRWFHSDLELLPNDHVGLFVSLNSPGKDGAAGPVRTALFNGFMDRYFPGPAQQGHVDPAVEKADAARMAGTYDDSRRSQSSFMSLLNLLNPVKVTADAQGRVSSSILRGVSGEPETFQEIGPLLWREVNGKDLMGAKADASGKVTMFSGGEISPFMVFQPSPAWRSAAWLWPALLVAVGVLLLTGVLWPVTAIVRRRYGAAFALSGAPAHSYRLVRGGALLSAALMIGWLITVVTMLQTFSITAAMDPWILTLHLLSTVVFPLFVAVAAWDVYAVWTRRSGWRAIFGRGWSLVVLAASLVLLWVALVHHLIGFNLNY